MSKVLQSGKSVTYSEEKYGQKDDKPKQVISNKFYLVINNQQFISSP